MKKGDKFTNAYEENANFVFQYALARVKEEELAKEFVQQVFLIFFEHIHEVPEDIIRPWLLLCCKREIIDYLRKVEIQNRYYNRMIRTGRELIVEDNAERIVDHMVKEEFLFRMLEGVKQKNESWYRIIEAVGILEMSQEEAAKQLGLSNQVFRAKLYRARKFIKKEYGEEYLRL